jgi:hypothetical protein
LKVLSGLEDSQCSKRQPNVTLTIPRHASCETTNHCCVHELSLTSLLCRYVCYVPRGCEFRFLEEINESYLRCKLQARQCFGQVSLERACHDKHESLRVTSQRILQQICQLSKLGDVRERCLAISPLNSDTEYEHPPCLDLKPQSHLRDNSSFC